MHVLAPMLLVVNVNVNVNVNINVSIYVQHQQAYRTECAGCASTVRTNMSLARLPKADLVEFGLRTGFGRLFQADGPALVKAGRPYMLVMVLVMVHRCLNGRAPQYLAIHCVQLPSLSVPLGEIYCRYHVTDSTRAAAARLFPVLVRLPGTVFWTLSAIRTPPKLFSGA